MFSWMRFVYGCRTYEIFFLSILYKHIIYVNKYENGDFQIRMQHLSVLD